MYSWGHAQHLIHMIHPIFSLPFSGQGALFHVAVGEDSESGSMCQPCSQYSHVCLCVITSKRAAQGQAVDVSEGEAHWWFGSQRDQGSKPETEGTVKMHGS